MKKGVKVDFSKKLNKQIKTITCEIVGTKG